MKKVPDFKKKDEEKLIEFLKAPERPDGTMDYFTLCGFLFTVACAPDIVNFSEWMPLVFDDEDPGYKTLEDAKFATGLLLSLYNHINRQVLERKTVLPDSLTIDKDPLKNFGSYSPLSRWSAGYMMGHEWLEESWEEYIPDGLDEEMGGAMMALSFFSSRKLAEAFLEETAQKGMPLEKLASGIIEMLPVAMESYASLGRAIWEAIYAAEHAKIEKVGRNDACPCGSGKKYKKCCLNKEETVH